MSASGETVVTPKTRATLVKYGAVAKTVLNSIDWKL